MEHLLKVAPSEHGRGRANRGTAGQQLGLPRHRLDRLRKG